MVQDDVISDGWLPLSAVAERLGLSIHAVRRRVHAGELPARQVRTRYGLAWQVRLDGERAPSATVTQGVREGNASLAQESEAGAGTPQDTQTDLMRAEAMAAYTRSLLEPLTAALERSQGRVAELERDTGRLTAELERATSTVVALGDELAAAESSRRREHRLLRIGLVVLATLLVALAVAPVWVPQLVVAGVPL
jgi:hypothetical protein